MNIVIFEYKLFLHKVDITFSQKKYVEFKPTIRFSASSYQIVINLENYKQETFNNSCQQSSVTNEIKLLLFHVSENFIKIIVVKQDIFGSHKERRVRDKSILRNGWIWWFQSHCFCFFVLFFSPPTPDRFFPYGRRNGYRAF